MTQQAMRAPALPVVRLSGAPPRPRSSSSRCICKTRQTRISSINDDKMTVPYVSETGDVNLYRASESNIPLQFFRLHFSPSMSLPWPHTRSGLTCTPAQRPTLKFRRYCQIKIPQKWKLLLNLLLNCRN